MQAFEFQLVQLANKELNELLWIQILRRRWILISPIKPWSETSESLVVEPPMSIAATTVDPCRGVIDLVPLSFPTRWLLRRIGTLPVDAGSRLQVYTP